MDQFVIRRPKLQLSSLKNTKITMHKKKNFKFI